MICGARRSRLAAAVFSAAASIALFAAPAGSRAEAPERVPVLFIGMQHFVSRANVYNLAIGDVLAPRRQREIAQIANRLARFRPTIVIVERTRGTSAIEAHYRAYLAGRFRLPADEPYQIGFRVARAAGLRDVHDIDYFNDFPYEAVAAYARAHGQTALLDACDGLNRRVLAREAAILRSSTLLELLRYINDPAIVAAGHGCYLDLDRIGDPVHPVGVRLVSGWYDRNLHLYANMMRLVRSRRERVLVLYGQGHEYLMQQFVRDSPDLRLVDPVVFL